MDYGWILKAKTWIPNMQTDLQKILPMSPQIRCLPLGVMLKNGSDVCSTANSLQNRV